MTASERQRERCRKWYAANRDYARRKHRQNRLLREYGLTAGQFAIMVAVQDGQCAACFRTLTFEWPASKTTAAVDHDHQTGRVRSILCMRCNLAVGQLEDDPTRAYAAAEYLQRHGK